MIYIDRLASFKRLSTWLRRLCPPLFVVLHTISCALVVGYGYEQTVRARFSSESPHAFKVCPSTPGRSHSSCGISAAAYSELKCCIRARCSSMSGLSSTRGPPSSRWR